MVSDRGFQRQTDLLLTILAIASTCFTALLLASALPDEALHNSDILYAPAFVQDLWSGQDVSGWTLPPAPYFFPDLLLVGAVDCVFRLLDTDIPTRIDLVLRLSASLLFLLNGTGFSMLLQRLFVPRPSFRLGWILWMAIGLTFMLVPWTNGSYLAAHVPTNHSGLLVLYFFFWANWLSVNRLPVRMTIAAGILISGILSDKQFLVLTILPAMVLSLYRCRYRENLRREFYDCLLLLSVWMIVERLLPRIRYDLIFFPDVGLLSVWEQLVTRPSEEILQELLSPAFIGPFVLIVIALSAGWLSLKGQKRHASIEGTLAILISGMTGVFSAAVLHLSLSQEKGITAPVPGRYLHFLYVTIFPLIVAMFAYRPFLLLQERAMHDPRASKMSRILALCILSSPLLFSLLFPITFPLSGMASRGILSRAFREAECVKQAAVLWSPGAGKVYGVSDYWNARRLSMFGNPRIQLLPVNPNSVDELYYWITNLSWFNRAGIIYSFVVTNGLNKEHLIELYGDPLRRVQCSGLEVWWYGEQSPIEHRPEDIRAFASVIGVPWRQRSIE